MSRAFRARTIGLRRQETVTYVSNIFKYYVAYQLVSDAERDRAASRQQMESTLTP